MILCKDQSLYPSHLSVFFGAKGEYILLQQNILHQVKRHLSWTCPTSDSPTNHTTYPISGKQRNTSRIQYKTEKSDKIIQTAQLAATSQQQVGLSMHPNAPIP